jgi:hypothetical protein
VRKYAILLVFVSVCVYGQFSTRPGFGTGTDLIGVNKMAFEVGFPQTIAIDYDLSSRIECRIENDFPAITLSTKYLIFNHNYQIAVLGNYSKRNSSALLLIQKHFGNFTALNNSGFNINGTFIYSLSLSYSINNLSFYAEIFNDNYDIGTYYLVTKDLQIDLSYYKDLINGGLIWRI